MVRLAASLVGFLALLVQPALAGDRAQIELIGYSAEGSYFAFEEFGIQDGSGFAYSNIYVIDLTEDSWVVGTPFRLQADDEDQPLTEIRAENRAKADNSLATLHIAVPAEYLAMLGDGVPDADGRTMAFGMPGFQPGAVRDAHALELSRFGTQSATPCREWFGSVPQGYALTLKNEEGERLVHRDDNLPRSRGCPVDYRLFGVVMPFGDAALNHAVAIVSVYTYGFEGPDRRFIVVPLGL